MTRTVLESLNHGLHRAFQADERVLLLGEDVLDPYGGAFKVSRGISSSYPERVLTTPISEAGIVGVAAGMALRGLRPVVEIMFGDFLTLAADQLINHAAKFRFMYNDQVRVPMVVRTPMGGRRGYGPTHSQSLEKHFIGVPGLSTVAISHLGDPGTLLEEAIRKTEDPLLFVENKLLYLLPLEVGVGGEFEISKCDAGSLPFRAPTYTLRLKGAPPPAITIGAYGHMAALAQEAVLQLGYKHEIFAELVVPTALAPATWSDLIESARRTGQVVLAEESPKALGWSAEAAAQLSESLGPALKALRRVSAAHTPIPASAPLEATSLPQVDGIVQAAVGLVSPS